MELTKEYVSALLPKRPLDANKGTFGKVLVIAGSKNYPGAAYLACAAAYRVGAGLVTLVTDDIVKINVLKKLPEVTFLSFNEIIKQISSYDVLLLGPGLGQSIKIRKLVIRLLKEKIPQAVIDGDGLNILSGLNQWWDKLNGEVILTPHPGEMGRLTGKSVDEIQFNRENIAKDYAKKWKQVVVLKGANTVIVSPTGEVRVSPFANPSLATAGTGDVLSGIITGFLAQGISTFNAACLGVYIHGLAGEVLRENLGDAGVIASDILPILPRVIKSILQTPAWDLLN